MEFKFSRSLFILIISVFSFSCSQSEDIMQPELQNGKNDFAGTSTIPSRELKMTKQITTPTVESRSASGWLQANSNGEADGLHGPNCVVGGVKNRYFLVVPKAIKDAYPNGVYTLTGYDVNDVDSYFGYQSDPTSSSSGVPKIWDSNVLYVTFPSVSGNETQSWNMTMKYYPAGSTPLGDSKSLFQGVWFATVQSDSCN